MPELPEVETIKLGLQQHLVGHTIRDVQLFLPKQFRGDPKQVIGGKVVGVRRFGKGLVVDLDNGFSLAVHVKMTGQLLYDAATTIPRGPATSITPRCIQLPDSYTHIVFHLDRGGVLYYRDVRQFGWVHALPTKEIAEHAFFRSLGPEPLKDLTYEIFSQILKQVRTPIKIVLMDQRKIAGIGNIYANDALYLAKIHPKRQAGSLSPPEVKKLFTAIETVLQKSITLGGASERDYVDVMGEKGQYQNHFLVYRKDGQPCERCGTLIERITLGGRGTFFCHTCQEVK